jgi:ATP-dependent RNA helicase DDX19/DBP5
MTEGGHTVISLHAAKDPQERDRIIDSFRDGQAKVLITTNVIARGIDISQVNLVVNYDLPLMNERQQGKDRSFNDGSRDGDLRPDVETYIHRIGVCSFFLSSRMKLVLMRWVL